MPHPHPLPTTTSDAGVDALLQLREQVALDSARMLRAIDQELARRSGVARGEGPVALTASPASPTRIGLGWVLLYAPLLVPMVVGMAAPMWLAGSAVVGAAGRFLAPDPPAPAGVAGPAPGGYRSGPDCAPSRGAFIGGR